MDALETNGRPFRRKREPGRVVRENDDESTVNERHERMLELAVEIHARKVQLLEREMLCQHGRGDVAANPVPAEHELPKRRAQRHEEIDDFGKGRTCRRTNRQR